MTATAERTYCNLHGYRIYEGICSLCAGTSNQNMLGGGSLVGSLSGSYPRGALGSLAQMQKMQQANYRESFSLDTFLAEVKDSCTNHAERKGYTTAQNKDAGDVLGPCLTTLGIARDHSLGEIVAKIVEYRHTPRRVLAVKIAGWAWRLWLNTES